VSADDVQTIPEWRLRTWGTFQGGGRRKAPPVRLQRKILEQQGGRCLYCDCEFGSTIYRKGKAITVRLNWDHVVPFAYSRTSVGVDFVAACHVCNGIKTCLMFDSVNQAREHILAVRQQRGYPRTAWEARTADDEVIADPWAQDRVSECPSTAEDAR
jgi:hypothetical protein